MRISDWSSDVCSSDLQPKAGETVVVSAASGAVGSVVGQLARRRGCRAVGIAGGKAKCAIVTQEFGFDACVDYKSPDFASELAAAVPQGIDVYFDNVAGPILDTVLPLLNNFERIPLCGLEIGRACGRERVCPYV